MPSIRVKQKRKRFSMIKSILELENYISELPDGNEVYKFLSDGGFCSSSFIIFVADRCCIHDFYVYSFRIGKKELKMIDRLFSSGVIGQCHFAVGTLMANDSENLKKYKYYENFKELCDYNKWEYLVVNNHSKVLLFDTDLGKFVLETSSNLNENPKIEQFSFEQSAELYEFYRRAYELWKGEVDRE